MSTHNKGSLTAVIGFLILFVHFRILQNSPFYLPNMEIQQLNSPVINFDLVLPYEKSWEFNTIN